MDVKNFSGMTPYRQKKFEADVRAAMKNICEMRKQYGIVPGTCVDANSVLVSAYEREVMKLCSDISKHYLKKNTLGDWHEYWGRFGKEIYEAAESCIKKYSEDRGDFMHFFYYVLKRKVQRSEAEELMNSRTYGMVFEKRTKLLLHKLVKYMEATGMERPSKEFIAMFAETQGISEDEVREILLVKSCAFVVSLDEIYENEDGHETTFVEMVKGEDGRAVIDSILTVEETLNAIGEVIDDSLDNQKPLLRDYATALICKCNLTNEYDELIKQQQYINMEIIEDYNARYYIPTDKAIGEKYGRSKESFSRTLKNYKYKIRGMLSQALGMDVDLE